MNVERPPLCSTSNVGDPIALDEQAFTGLAAAIFAEIEKRYVAQP